MAQHNDEKDDLDTEETPFSERDLATLQKINDAFAWRREDTRLAQLRGRLESDNRFRIIRLHGTGGLGEVFVAKDQVLDRDVALKWIREPAGSESKARLVREAKIIGKLEHPGIVPAYSLECDHDGQPYYAMRLIRGDSLLDAIGQYHKNGRDNTDLRHLLDRFRAICNAIAYAHRRGVIHRDLKPANVMLGEFGETLVIDWGLAKQLGETAMCEPGGDDAVTRPRSDFGDDATPTRQGTVMGTLAYMSPEQRAGKMDEVGPASDIYSLGATLYHILTGNPPEVRKHVGEEASDLTTRVLTGEATEHFAPAREANPEIPGALDAICLKAMAHNPRHRYASAQHLADDVEKWLADDPVSAWSEPWSERARRWVGRHPGVTLALGVTLILSISFAVFLNNARSDAERAKQEAEKARNDAEQARAAAEGAKEEADRQRDKADYYANSILPLTGAGQTRISGDTLYKLAAVYAGSADTVQRDRGLEAKERERLFANYADRAIELLRRAKGISKVHLINLKLDKDFDAIRDREGFGKLFKD